MDLVDGSDVGMMECRGGFDFALKSAEACGSLLNPFLCKAKPPHDANFATDKFFERPRIVENYRRHQTLLQTLHSGQARQHLRLSRCRRKDCNSRMVEQARITDKDLVRYGIHN